ncbi:Ribonuclease P protein component 1 [Candidatus Norongarragalina meridionalis]|nr:Ribonuclease P protein component 1 [Candidatus Norongarragalina meridionalis]
MRITNNPKERKPSPKRGRRQGCHERFLAGEFIGEQVRVVNSSCKGLLGIEGRISDETLNTFVLETREGVKRLPKKACVFFFPDAGETVDGMKILHRPEDRTKKIAKQK